MFEVKCYQQYNLVKQHTTVSHDMLTYVFSIPV